MRLNKIKWMALMLCTLLVSCFEDESTLATKELNNIELFGVEANYQCTAYVGEILEINPIVDGGYSDEELDFEWTLLDATTGSTDSEGNMIEPVVIGTEKKLSYEVAIAPGAYQIRFTATSKEYGYSATITASVNVVTEFSHGFYVLKETLSGETDVDLFSGADSKSENVIAAVNGQSLPGKPSNICINYGQFYINEETDKIDKANTVIVMTDERELGVYRGTDMKQVFSRDNILFYDMEADEYPYTMFRDSYYTTYVSSKGIRQVSADNSLISMGYSSPSSGKFGFPVGNISGGSRFAYYDYNAYGIYYWNDELHSLMACDYYGSISVLRKEDETGEDLTSNLVGYRCLACGMNEFVGGCFILEDTQEDQRYIYVTKSDFMKQYLKERRTIPQGSHMDKAELFSVNALSGQYIYCIDDNKLYGCNLASDNLAEVEMQLEGIPANETLVYVSNIFFNAIFSNSANNFDYLAVGTQNGNTYSIYLYKMLGGAPDGAPVEHFSGEGKLKSLRFLCGTGCGEYDFSYGDPYHNLD